MELSQEIQAYNEQQSADDKAICELLAATINDELTEAENKIWHAHPVWFLDDNPVVGYSKQKAGWRLMFWSGASFDVPELHLVGKKFKDASVIYNSLEEINPAEIKSWLKLSKNIQWDYKNIVKRKGRLERLK